MSTEQPSKERPTTEEAGPSDEAGVDDFLARNVTMTNTMPGGASPYAGALVGRTEDSFEPTTDEERLGEAGLDADADADADADGEAAADGAPPDPGAGRPLAPEV